MNASVSNSVSSTQNAIDVSTMLREVMTTSRKVRILRARPGDSDAFTSAGEPGSGAWGSSLFVIGTRFQISG